MRLPSDKKDSALATRTFLQDKFRARRAGISKFQYGCYTVMPELCQVMPRWYAACIFRVMHFRIGKAQMSPSVRMTLLSNV